MTVASDVRVLQITLVLIAFSLGALPAQAKYGGGAGEPNAPYLIYTAEQMNAIGAEPNDWDKHFRLMADIDLTSLGSVPFNIIGAAPQTPTRRTVNAPDDQSLRAADDANSTGPFSGVFDGDGHAISGFVYTSTARGDVGLFGTVSDPNAEIRNLRLIAPRIDISAGVDTGSLVGHLWQGTIVNCRAENVDVHGHWENVGGLVGESGSLYPYPGTYAMILNSSCTGRVSSESSTAGGLVGKDSYGSFDQCFAGCDVSGKEIAGGLVGYTTSSRFLNCYSTGNVTATEVIGGLLGWNSQVAVTKCYSAGRVTGAKHTGGLAAPSTPSTAVTITASFWDAQINGLLDNADATGRTTAEMQDPNMFIAAGWNFVDKSDGPGDIWAEPAGGGYPIFWWQLPEPPALPFPGGTGAPDDPYLIATAEQLNSIGHNPRLMQAHFKVIDNIDLAGLHFYPIGNEDYAFGGAFDGGNFAISNLACAAVEAQDVGLFRIISTIEAEVRNVRLVDPVIDAANAQNVGSLAGRLWQGTIRNCHVEGGRISGKTVGGLLGQSGIPMDIGFDPILVRVVDCSASTTVVGQAGVGGLIGMNTGASLVSGCRADGSVSGQREVGGLVGWHFLAITIINSHSGGTVSGKQAVGGLVGGNGYGDIQRSFSTANVQGDTQVGGLVGLSYGTIADCYTIASTRGKDKVGGLVGQNGYISSHSDDPGTISNCYSAGRVSGTQSVAGLVGYNQLGTTAACFWDRETSSLRTKSGNTTSQMHTASTFLDAGWDFVDETQNGAEDIWWILEGQDYPRLNWERDNQP